MHVDVLWTNFSGEPTLQWHVQPMTFKITSTLSQSLIIRMTRLKSQEEAQSHLETYITRMSYSVFNH